MFLGLLISTKGTRLEENTEILRYNKPTSAKGLRQFLSMINFYRHFIPGASEVQASLNILLVSNLKGKAPVKWTQDANAAFKKCKENLVSAMLLAHPYDDKLST